MIDKIVHAFDPIGLIGGSQTETKLIDQVDFLVSCWVAADGGASRLIEAGRPVEAVIGDMDSLDPADLARIDAQRVHKIDEQDSTDFEKCLLRIDAPLVIAAGFLGGRLDHQLAVFHGLLRFAGTRCILVGAQEIVFLCPPALDLPLEDDVPVSLFPMGPVRVDGQGLEWSFEGLDMAPGVRVGTSNRSRGPISLTASEPALLCILPIAQLELVVRQLAAQHGSWRAHA